MNMTRKRFIGGATAFAAALLMTVGAFAQHGEHGRGGPGHRGPGGHGGPGMHGGLLGPLAREMNLTDAQKAQVKQITAAFRESTKGLHEQLSRTGGGPLEALEDGAFDEAAVRAAAQARANLHVELEVAHARMMSQVYSLLTAEQKARLAEHRQQFEKHRRQTHSPGDEGDAPPGGR